MKAKCLALGLLCLTVLPVRAEHLNLDSTTVRNRILSELKQSKIAGRYDQYKFLLLAQNPQAAGLVGEYESVCVMADENFMRDWYAQHPMRTIKKGDDTYVNLMLMVGQDYEHKGDYQKALRCFYEAKRIESQPSESVQVHINKCTDKIKVRSALMGHPTTLESQEILPEPQPLASPPKGPMSP